jgi:hypothetical protein
MSSIGRTFFAWLGVVLVPASLLAQSGSDGIPRTSWGAPDVQGFWVSNTLTPLERPEGYEDRAVVTGEEAEALVAQLRRLDDQGPDVTLSADFTAGRAGAPLPPNEQKTPLVDGRTSLIVDPPTGKVPSTPAAQARMAALFASFLGGGAAGPEDTGFSVRCIMFPPHPVDNSNRGIRLFQSEEHVVIYQEWIHESIVVPLEVHPPLPDRIRQWRGDSRGYWDGDSLVVETTNFNGAYPFQGSGPELRFVQRFTRVDEDTLDYSYTVEDPDAFTQPWTVAFPLTYTEADTYEYSCHEGNRTMPLILRGARALEQAAKFRGAFKLVSFDQYSEDGTGTPARYREGTLIYDASGRMSVHLMDPDRPVPSGSPTDADRSALYQGYIAYFGRYDVNVHQKVVRHQVEGGLSPGLIDQTVAFGYELADDDKTLILTMKERDRIVGRVTWERLE